MQVPISTGQPLNFQMAVKSGMMVCVSVCTISASLLLEHPSYLGKFQLSDLPKTLGLLTFLGSTVVFQTEGPSVLMDVSSVPGFQ